MNSSRDSEPAIDAIEEPRSRREMLRGGGIAAVAGLLAGGLVTSQASAAGDPVRDSAAKNGCGGKDGCPGKDKKKDKKKKKDKNGCSGKDGCGSKG